MECKNCGHAMFYLGMTSALWCPECGTHRIGTSDSIPIRQQSEGRLDRTLALAVLDGESDAVWPLMDDIMEKRDRPEDFVPREELLSLLLKTEWCQFGDGSSRCKICGGPYPNGHSPDCRLAAALGIKAKVT